MQSLRPHPQAVYRNVKDAFTKIISREGITRPMRGVNVVALGAGPAHAMYFGSYEIMKKFLGNNGNGGHFPVANGMLNCPLNINFFQTFHYFITFCSVFHTFHYIYIYIIYTRPSGLSNCIVCKRLVVQTLLWSLEFVLHDQSQARSHRSLNLGLKLNRFASY